MNKIQHKLFWLFAVFTALAILAATPALAQQPTADDINTVAKKLSCPTCTGISVAECPTETCAQWRAKIGDLITEGKGDQEILDYFATRYGDHVLQVPPKRGFFLWVWVLPALAILAGLVWLMYLMRRWSIRRAPVPAEYPQGVDRAAVSRTTDDDVGPEDEYLQRVQQDLERLS